MKIPLKGTYYVIFLRVHWSIESSKFENNEILYRGDEKKARFTMTTNCRKMAANNHSLHYFYHSGLIFTLTVEKETRIRNYAQAKLVFFLKLAKNIKGNETNKRNGRTELI